MKKSTNKMLRPPESNRLVFNHKEVIVQIGSNFYKLRGFKQTDGYNIDRDLDRLQRKYYITSLREAD